MLIIYRFLITALLFSSFVFLAGPVTSQNCRQKTVSIVPYAEHYKKLNPIAQLKSISWKDREPGENIIDSFGPGPGTPDSKTLWVDGGGFTGLRVIVEGESWKNSKEGTPQVCKIYRAGGEFGETTKDFQELSGAFKCTAPGKFELSFPNFHCVKRIGYDINFRETQAGFKDSKGSYLVRLESMDAQVAPFVNKHSAAAK